MMTPTAVPSVSGSIVADQAAALRAGIALLAMVDTVPLDLAVDARPYPAGAALLNVTIAVRSGSERDGERLEGFRAVVALLGLTVDVFDSTYSRTPTTHAMADTSIAGVPVHFWISLDDPDVIVSAHRAFPAPASAVA